MYRFSISTKEKMRSLHRSSMFCKPRPLTTIKVHRATMTRATGKVKKLLMIVGELQSHIGKARAYHENDRDPNGYALGQNELNAAFELCIDATSLYDPVDVQEATSRKEHP